MIDQIFDWLDGIIQETVDAIGEALTYFGNCIQHALAWLLGYE